MRSRLRDYGWRAVLAVLVGAVALIGPALLHPGARVAGLRSDPASEVWWLGEMASPRVGIVTPTTTPMVNAPDGSQIRRPVEISTLAIDVLAWPLYHLFGPVLVRNLLLLIGISASGFAMLVVGAAARLDRLAATVGALVFMYAPSLVTEAKLHVALVFAFPVPLTFAFGLLLIERLDRRVAVLLGAVVGGSCYVNPYVPLYAASTAVAIAAAALVAHHRRAIMPLAVAAGTSVMVAAPALVLLTVKRNDTVAAVRRSITELDQFAVSPVDLLRAFGPMVAGVLVVAVAGGGLWRVRTQPVVLAAALVAAAGVLLSLGPETHLGDRRIALPNQVLFDVYPAWRVVGRAAVLVWFVAGLGLAYAVSTVPRRSVRRAELLRAVAVVAAVVWVGGSFRDGRPWFAANETPALSALLATREGAVAEYPLFAQDNDAIGPYLLRQRFHGRPLVNGGLVGTVSGDIAQVAGHLDDPQTAAALQLGGVHTVVVHGGTRSPLGAVLIGERDGAAVYDAAPVADPAIAVWVDAYGEEESGELRWRWIPAGASLRVTSATPGRFLVRMKVLATGSVGMIRFGGQSVAVAPAEHDVEVCVETKPGAPVGLARGTVALTPDAPAVKLGPSDPREAIARARDARVVGRCT